MSDSMLPQDHLTNGWLPLKSIVIPSSPMVVPPKSIIIPFEPMMFSNPSFNSISYS